MELAVVISFWFELESIEPEEVSVESDRFMGN